MITDSYDWPGWPLENSPYGKEFDQEARHRMILGSQLLLPLMHKWDVGTRALEVGPFFNPLLTPSQFPSTDITFMENDPHVLRYLRESYPQTMVLAQDLDTLSSPLLGSYTAVVASHLLNYIDYKNFLKKVPYLLAESGYFFLNNSPHYGLSPFFSAQRPLTNEETIDAILAVGLEIKEYALLPTPDSKYQPQERLLLVAQKNS